MKTAETKSTTAAACIQAKRPGEFFFKKEGQSRFLPKERTPFFSKGLALQRKLSIGRSGDRYEQEADQVADTVVQKLSVPAAPEIQKKQHTATPQIRSAIALQQQSKEDISPEQDLTAASDELLQKKPIFESNAEQSEADIQTKSIHSSLNPETVQPKPATFGQEENLQTKEDETEQEEVQSKLFSGVNIGPPDERGQQGFAQTKNNDTSQNIRSVESRLHLKTGSGSPLPAKTQSAMGSVLGADLSNVRIHTGSDAVQMNEHLGSQAFTHGSDIYFNKGKYDSNSQSGQHLLAHELTHTIQQGKSVRKKAKRDVSISQAPSTIQRFSVWDAARRVGRGIAGGARSLGRGVVSGARSFGRGVANLAQSALDMGRDALMAVVRRVAPDFATLIERDGIRNVLRNLISQAFRSLFQGISSPIRNALGVFRSLGQRITGGLGRMRAFISGVASNAFTAIRTAATSVGSFLEGIVSPVFSGIRSVAGRVKNFFSGINEVIGVPIMNILRRIGGGVWDNFTGFVQRVGNIFRAVKNAIGGAWTRIKGWFGITADQGTGEGGGIWEWIKGKALALWNTIKQRIEPIKTPLRAMGSVLLLLSPAGPALALFRAWPHLKRAFAWVRQQWRDGNVLVRARQYLNSSLMPLLTSGLQRVGTGLVQAADWLIGMLTRVQITTNSFLGALGSPILAPLRSIVNFSLNHFKNIVASARIGVLYVSTHVSQIFRRIREFLMKVWEVVRKIIAIAVNPFGIAGLVLGNVWRAMPDSVKGKIIDWIINLLIRVIRVIPSNPLLGLLWPFIKDGVLGFLERMLAFQTQRKVNASNKMATIMSGGSPSFAFGYLRGLVMGVWEGITGPFMMIRDLFELPGLISNFVSNLGQQFSEMFNQARELIASIAGNAVGTFQSLINGLRDLLSNPRRIIDIISSAIEAAMNAVRGIGASIAERLMSLMEQADDKIGELLGNLTGQFLFEAVLAALTAGGSAAVGAIRQVANVLRRIARNIMPIIRRILQFLPRIRPFIQRLTRLFGRAGTGASDVLQRVRRFIDRVMEWFQDALNRMRGRGRAGGRADLDTPDRRRTPGRERDADRRRRRDEDEGLDPEARRRRRDRDDDNDPSWLRIRSAIRNDVRRFERDGATHVELTNAIRGIGMRFRGSRPSVRSEGEAQWQIMAMHPTYRAPREAADVYKDKATRWRLGGIAVRRRLERLTDREKNLNALRRILLPIENEYGYRYLRPENDQRENDINIMGGMSPRKSLGKIQHSVKINDNNKYKAPKLQKLGPAELMEVKLDQEADIVYQNYKTRVNNRLSQYGSYGISRNTAIGILRETRNQVDPERLIIRSFDLANIGNDYLTMQYRIDVNVKSSSNGPINTRILGNIKRLPTGKNRKEAIPITWVMGGYPVLTLQAIARRNNPVFFDQNDLPPSGRITARWNQQTTLVVPISQRNEPQSALYCRRRITIGVTPLYTPRPGRHLRRRISSEPGVRGPTGTSFRTLLRNHGYDLRVHKMQADHVIDLGFGGQDVFQNLWPLNSAVNQSTATSTWRRQPLAYRFQISGEESRMQPISGSLKGKWFVIKDIRRGSS